MNLVIDIGNTLAKAALFEEKRLLESKVYQSLNDILLDLPFINQAKRAIVGSVVDPLDDFSNSLNCIIPTLVFTSKTRIPLINLYQSASTLGSDRLSASIGAFYLYPNSDVLVIDAGTCIKYNFVNSDNEYLGGGISLNIIE